MKRLGTEYSWWTLYCGCWEELGVDPLNCRRGRFGGCCRWLCFVAETGEDDAWDLILSHERLKGFRNSVGLVSWELCLVLGSRLLNGMRMGVRLITEELGWWNRIRDSWRISVELLASRRGERWRLAWSANGREKREARVANKCWEMIADGELGSIRKKWSNEKMRWGFVCGRDVAHSWE